MNKKEFFKNPIYNCIKIIKHLSLNLTKEVKDLNLEKCKTLIKEIENTNKQKDTLYSQIGRINS